MAIVDRALIALTGTAKNRRGSKAVVTGVKELDATLRMMPVRLQRKLSKDACRVACKEIVLPDAQRDVPVDSGELESSLIVKTMKRYRDKSKTSRSRSGETLIGWQVTTKYGMFEGDTFYGGFQEYGWRDKWGNFHEGTPFLRPALWSNAAKIHTLFVAVLRGFVKAEARRAFVKKFLRVG